jgi:hypothetical protein
MRESLQSEEKHGNWLKLQTHVAPFWVILISLTIAGQYSLFPHNWRVRVRHEQ